jgi:hypothetical protein
MCAMTTERAAMTLIGEPLPTDRPEESAVSSSSAQVTASAPSARHLRTVVYAAGRVSGNRHRRALKMLSGNWFESQTSVPHVQRVAIIAEP